MKRRSRVRTDAAVPRYILEDQVGYLLRLAIQRHSTIFTRRMVANLTRTQFAALAKLVEVDSCAKNELGRLVGLDRATIGGVIDRLKKHGYVAVLADKTDRRRSIIKLTDHGRHLLARAIPAAHSISQETLAPLANNEQKHLISLLRKIAEP